MPICYLEKFSVPDRWNKRSMPVHDLDTLFAALDEIAEKDGESGAAPSAIIRKTNGDSLHVGMSPVAWLMILREGAGPSQMVRGKAMPGEPIAFLIPEWTDFEREELMEPAKARRAIQTWLAGGNIKTT